MKRQLKIDLENKKVSINYVNNDEQINIENDDLNFYASMLCGYKIIGVNRIEVFSKDKTSKAGGFFSHYLKCNNYDFISIKGKSKSPVFIYINKGYVKIYDAKDFFFNNYKESKKIIENILEEENIEMCSISSAGACKVNFAKVMFGEKKSCGKNGLGKLMGEKNLKAIVLKKEDDLRVKDENILNEINKNISDRLNNNNEISSYFKDENNCYGCNINCESTSIKKLVNKGIKLQEAKIIDQICNEYGMDSIVFSQFLKKQEDITKLVHEIIKNPSKYKNKEELNIKKHKKENELDKLGFCKFLTNKDIITKEELENLIKMIEG